jgi:hypothetical protein
MPLQTVQNDGSVGANLRVRPALTRLRFLYGISTTYVIYRQV